MSQTIILTGYRLLSHLAGFFLPVLGVFVPKVREWIQLRSGVWAQDAPSGRMVIWMHCSSLGEFEQGRPVWEGIRRAYPEAWLLLSFFSGSGYNRQKDNPEADRVVCLPLDTPANAKRWMEAFHPDLILWVKYDFWFHYWLEAHHRQVPIVLFAARFRADQFLARPWARPFREIILSARMMAVQDESSRALATQWGATQVVVAGDTRIDRVLDIVRTPYQDEWIEAFVRDHPVIIGGSVWDEDLDILLPVLQDNLLKGWKWILAPHDLQPDRIRRILDASPVPCSTYTGRGEIDAVECQLLVLDTIGMLNKVYRWTHLAYVGGGFGRSVHSLLEPAAYGLPVLFGPRHDKFPEAAGLIRAEGGFEVENEPDMRRVLGQLSEETARVKAGRSAMAWLHAHRGATDRVLAGCEAILKE